MAVERRPGVSPSSDRAPESLMDRRRRELRQNLSEAATRMFLERGFDAVKVADVAAACGVTEKTVFNHFPRKEALLADRWDEQTSAICHLLGDPRRSPLDAVLAVLERDAGSITAPAQVSAHHHLRDLRRFNALMKSSPSLGSYNRDKLHDLATAIAGILANRWRVPEDAPEPCVTATAVTGLWHVYAQSLQRHLDNGDLAQIANSVRDDLHSAANILRRGLQETDPHQAGAVKR